MTRLALILPLMGLGLVAGRPQEGAPVDEPATPAAVAADSPDEAAIRAVVAELVRAFNAGDAPAIAALFTEDARVQSDGDDAITGRQAIEKHYAEVFERGSGRTIALQTENLRMLGPDAAIEEGTAVVEIPADVDEDEARALSARYSVAYVKREGKWLQDSVHDYPGVDQDDEKSAHDHLEDLQWLIGEWIDEHDKGEVHTTCDWSEDGAFLIRRFTLKLRDNLIASGVQRIGWDPSRKQFRSWTFDADGGFADGFWSTDGARWTIKVDGVLSDGRSTSATNVITREGADVIRWTSISRTAGGAAFPDSENVTLVRKPPEPDPDAHAAEAPTPSQRPQPKESPR